MGRSEEPARVAVIIPFYQRTPGLLVRTVRSALSQSGGLIDVIVIDDGSPVRAAREVVALSPAEAARVRVIEQPNAGPGAARNRGLAAVPQAVDYVAFLDSDDAWGTDHIARALICMREGADFYFADYVPLHSDRSTFALCGLRPDDPAHAPLGDGLHAYGGDVFDALLRRSPVGTSTVVFRKSIAAGCAFPSAFSYCEDVFFWMQLSRRARTIMFSSRTDVHYGSGVNIAAGTAWGQLSNLRKLLDEDAFHVAVTRAFVLDDAQRRWSARWRRKIARAFVANALHLLRRGEAGALPLLYRFAAMRLVGAAPHRPRGAAKATGHRLV